MEAAQRHFAAGEKAYSEGRYDAALNDFTTSYELSKEPDLLYNLHQVALKLGQKEMAVGYLREYMQKRPAEATKIQGEIDAIQNPAPKPAPAAIDTRPTEAAPSRAPAILLMIFGSASVATGAALLGASLTSGGASSDPQHRSMLGAGSFLLATGALETAGGLALYLRNRPKAPLVFRPAGAGLQLAGQF